MQLIEIKESVQQIANAVASILKMEVEVADARMVRVAGTGKAQIGLLSYISGQYIYQSVLKKGEAVIIKNPGEHPICKPCTFYGNCSEIGEICCPIKVDGESVGVIGLLAFNEEQKERLFADEEAVVSFLQKMADLIASKLREYRIYKEQQVTVKKLTTVMDYLDKGVISIDNYDRITHINNRAKQDLKITEFSDQKKLNQKVQIILNVLRNTGHDLSNQKIRLDIDGEEKEFIVSCAPIVINEAIVETLITLDSLNQMVQIAETAGIIEKSNAFKHILGNSRAITRCKEVAEKIARTDATVLILGESGTGKELFARAIHQASKRKDGRFISINCGAIPEHLVESELFGYDDGAFTGARKGGKIGKFELADGGTIFLDEIGDMPFHLQVKLLRVLQEKEVERIGSDKTGKQIDVRIIAATHSNLDEQVKKGAFREDLYYRLSVIPFRVLPLRERREDILIIAYHYLQEYSNLLQKDIQGFTLETQNILSQYDWPGNVRELANAIEFAVIMEHSSHIQHYNLPEKLLKQRPNMPVSNVVEREWDELNLNVLEKRAITLALKRVSYPPYRREQAAGLLGISRASLFRKIKEYNIEAND